MNFNKPLQAIAAFLIVIGAFASSLLQITAQTPKEPMASEMPETGSPKLETAVLGMGCFWCSQALFEKFAGVKKVVCGYAGGTTVKPSYEDVCSETTGHAEVVEITFDPSVISYSKLLEVFWQIHDPTTPDQQGPDTGSSYRSIILYTSEEQHQEALASKTEAQKKFSAPITTEISPLKAFYAAEDYHQNYFKNHPNQPYCAFRISPEIQKLEQEASSLPAKLK